MASSNMHKRSPRHITTDCLIRPQLNPQLLEMIDSILQGRQNNQIELAPSYMNYEIVRLFTFATYPRKGKPDIRKFIIAGFYYAGFEDDVICYCCNLTESGWTGEDIPNDVHLQNSPKCAFYVRNPEVNFPFFDLMGHERSLNHDHVQTLQLLIKNASDDFQARGASSVLRPIVSVGSIHQTDSPSTPRGDTPYNLRRKAFSKRHMVHKRSKSLPLLQDSVREKCGTTQTTYCHHPMHHIRQLNFNTTPSISTRRMQQRLDDGEAISKEPEAEMNTSLCKICLDDNACVVFVPCGHKTCCVACSWLLEMCPLCKEQIRGRQNLLT